MKLAALLVCCACWCAGCSFQSAAVLKEDAWHLLQQELAEMAELAVATDGHAEPAGFILKVRAGGKTIFSHKTGLASADPVALIDEDTVFELASLSKVFTALAVMQLQEQGLLALDQDLGFYVPGLPKSWRGLTVHHLLSHQSGLPDLLNHFPRSRLDGMDVEGLKAYFMAQPTLLFRPGTEAVYSNTNYIFLAELVANISGKNFAQYLHTHVFEPAGMASSSVLAPVLRDVPNRPALPFAKNSKIHGIDYAMLGAINQKSSIQDLENFLEALLSHRLVQRKTLEHMLTPHVVFQDGKRYGYGWYIGQLGGWLAMSTQLPAAGAGHSGRLGAYRTALYFNRARDFQLIMLSNGGARTEKWLVNFLKKTRDRLE